MFPYLVGWYVGRCGVGWKERGWGEEEGGEEEEEEERKEAEEEGGA